MDEATKNFRDMIADMVERQVDKSLDAPDKQVVREQDPVVDSDLPRLYSTPDEYRAKTGKRFRMTKEQKQRGIDRDEAFQEFCDRDD